MTQPAYTDADVQLIVTATEQHAIHYREPDADGHDPCSCGQWREGADGSSWDEHMAEVSLAALAAAGRLLPAQTATEWGVRFLDGKTRQPHSKVYEAVTERQARAFAVSHCHVGEVGEVLTRKVTSWIAAEEPA